MSPATVGSPTAAPSVRAWASATAPSPEALVVTRGAWRRTVHPVPTVRTTDGRLAATGRAVVRFRHDTSPDARRAVHRTVEAGGARVLRAEQVGAAHTEVVTFDSATRLDAALALYRVDPRVRGAEPDYYFRTAEIPDDPHFPHQWNLATIRAPEAWDIVRGAASAPVAILDCGIYEAGSSTVGPGHPDLNGKVVAHANFTTSPDADDFCNHGTHTAGIAAAATNNGVGVAGVGHDARLLNAKVLDDDGGGFLSWILAGIGWSVASGARVINLSLSAPVPCPAALQEAIDRAWAANVVLVGSAGNDGLVATNSPANCNHVISVAATGPDDARAPFSNRGVINVAAPGAVIYSTDFIGGYTAKSGTSQAAAHVSGLAALVWSTEVTSAQAVRDRILGTADPVPLSETQFGRINAARAVRGEPAPQFFDLVVDERRQRIYGSDQAGGQIWVLARSTLQVLTKVPIGKAPAGLDISPDGRELAVALSGDGQIAFLDLESLSIVARLTPAVDGLNRPFDLIYGRPGRLYTTGNPDSTSFDYVHVFDTATRTELGRGSEIVRFAPRLALAPDRSALYVAEFAQRLHRFDVTTDTPVLTHQGPPSHSGVRSIAVSGDGKNVYMTGGEVWPADLSTKTTPFVDAYQGLNTTGGISGELEYDPTRERLFVGTQPHSTRSHVIVVDAITFQRQAIERVWGDAPLVRRDGTSPNLLASSKYGVERISFATPPTVSGARLPAIATGTPPALPSTSAPPAAKLTPTAAPTTAPPVPVGGGSAGNGGGSSGGGGGGSSGGGSAAAPSTTGGGAAPAASATVAPTPALIWGETADGRMEIAAPGRAPLVVETGTTPNVPNEWCRRDSIYRGHIRLEDEGIAGATFGVVGGGTLDWIPPEDAGCVDWAKLGASANFTKDVIMQFALLRPLPGALLWVLDGDESWRSRLYEVGEDGQARYVSGGYWQANQAHFQAVWKNVMPASWVQVADLQRRGLVASDLVATGS